jgi:hypothetical protein
MYGVVAEDAILWSNHRRVLHNIAKFGSKPEENQYVQRTLYGKMKADEDRL